MRTVDKTKTPNVVSVTPDVDPAKNDPLGNNRLDWGDIPPLGFTGQYQTPAGLKTFNEGFTAEVRWNVSDLGLTPGHTYRMQFMVHDGDQNKTGGDSGEACRTVVIPSSGG